MPRLISSRLSLGLVLSLAATGMSMTLVVDAHPPHADDVTIKHKHATANDEQRFFTDRDVPMLPLPEETDAFVFAIFGDRTGGPADGVRILAQAVEDVNLIEPDLVMTVGDLIEGYNATDQWMKQMREFKGIMDDLLCPWFPVAGNHDIYWRGDGRPDNEHEDHYEMHFGPLWYGFEHKNCGFIVLYTDEGNPETGERSINKAESQVMSEEQLEWLESALERTSELQHVFVFMHHPRWQRTNNRGDDWDRVHPILVEAGNVRAVFAGHIHVARYDGRVDGIEYVTLATVGGVQEGLAPKAGYLHHYNLVTVRPNQIAMSMIPVGETMDPRALTADVTQAARRLVHAQPGAVVSLQIGKNGAASQAMSFWMSNPTTRPIEVTLIPDSEDSRWHFAPDHDHATIEPGGTHRFKFNVDREPDSLDASFRLPELRRRVDYLAESARFEMPETRTPIDMRPELPRPKRPDSEHVLDVSDRRPVIIRSNAIGLPDNPLTIECWFNGNTFNGRRGLINKTENSEYGFFVSDGHPAFYIHLDGSYVNLEANDITLDTDRWYHIAGVFDGTEARLYLDGTLIAEADAKGSRTRNHLPLIIGADVDGQARPTSHFDGLIDAVHISAVARYDDDFTPSRRLRADMDTFLLLNMDERIALWLFDESHNARHPISRGPVIEAPGPQR